MSDIEKIIQQAKQYLHNCDQNKIYQAYEFARKAHEGQKRFSGEPYISHPLKACEILLSLRPDNDTICACLLHDVPEDTPFTLDDIKINFGEGIASLVEGMVKLSKVHPLDEDIQVDNLRRMFLAMAKDLRVVLIKFSDRLHNLRTLQYVPLHKQKRIARESLDIYAAIAARLGIYSIKTEIEDICFQYLYPKDFSEIHNQMKAQQQHREKFIDFVQNKLFDVFAKENIQAQIDSRIKHYFSIYRKLKRKNKNYVNELYDIVALRVVLEDVIDREQKYDYSKCYTTLGTIHKYWTPLTQRFKDYIAIPKGNGYKSLHTTVIGLGGKEFIHPTEIQIRTKQMHFESEFGIAAHWEYKENEVDLILSDKKQEWVKNLVSLHQDWHSNDEFLENLKIDIFKDRIFILTPRGDVKDLPQGATPIDFAYAVHSDLGHRFNGALVNDNIVPLDYKLQNGDIVKIISKKEAHPNLYWLSSVITNTAKSRIKQWFKSQDKDNLIKEGKILLNKQLERNNLPELPLNLSTIDLIHNKKLAMKERLEVLEQVGSGAVSPMLIVKKLIEKNKLLQRIKLQVPLKKNENPKSKLEVLIKGEQGYETRIAGCCSPQSSDQIVGFITKGTGIAIHKTSCVFIKKQINSSRIIEATWNCNEKETKLYKIIIESKTKTNSINDVIKIVTSYNIEVKSISTAEKKTNSIIHLKFKHSNFETVNKIFDRIEELPWVKMVKKEE